MPVFPKPHRASGLPPCPHAYPRKKALSLRRHEASVKHNSPVPSGSSFPEGSAFAGGARTQKQNLRQPSPVLTSISTPVLFLAGLGVCCLSQCDFPKFCRLQPVHSVPEPLRQAEEPIKVNEQTQSGRVFFLLWITSAGLEERSLQTCESKESNISLISDARLPAAPAKAVLKDTVFTAEWQGAQMLACKEMTGLKKSLELEQEPSSTSNQWRNISSPHPRKWYLPFVVSFPGFNVYIKNNVYI